MDNILAKLNSLHQNYIMTGITCSSNNVESMKKTDLLGSQSSLGYQRGAGHLVSFTTLFTMFFY